MNSLDSKYQALLQDILDNGVIKGDRTGTGTKSVFGRTIRHNMKEGFPLLTTKKMYFKGVVTELLWFLRGDTNIKYLVDNDCHIWDGDAYKRYLSLDSKYYDEWMSRNPTINLMWVPLSKDEFVGKVKTDKEFADEYGDLGPIYGKQWRKWEKYGFRGVQNGAADIGLEVESPYIDQILNLVNDLKTNPDSRRLMVTAWNPAELDQAVLPPCHYGFQVYTRELSLEERLNLIKNDNDNKVIIAYCENPKDTWLEVQINEVIYKNNIPTRAISLSWNQRSVDTFLGLPFNIASYGLLLEIIAREVNMIPEELIGNFGDTHLYLNHLEQAKEQITRSSFELPKLSINEGEPSIIDKPKYWRPEDFTIQGYQSHTTIKAPLSN